MKKNKLIFILFFVGCYWFLGFPTYDSSFDNTKESYEKPLIKVDERSVEDSEELLKENFVTIKIVAVGDIMMHGPQIISGYNKGQESYNFNAFFEDIKPYIKKGDLAIANLETTLAGQDRPYSGYPRFSAPDEIVDALKYAGFDTLITANNHSLDTGLEGLERTRQVIEQKEVRAVGTFNGSSGSQYLIKNIKGVKIALIAYTEHINGLENAYNPETLASVINIIGEEKIVSDIKNIKEHSPDIILAYMHWGTEYAKEPNVFQVNYADLLTQQGVDVIIGSHPHVIQKSETMVVGDNKSVIFYSLGNFISNQRRETLGDGYEATEDGVIINIDVKKNLSQNETFIDNIEMIPTWVYRSKNLKQANFSYQVLPIESYVSEESINNKLYNRIIDSFNETKDRMQLE